MIKTIVNFLKSLNSGTKPEELALASVIAMFAAFTLTPFNFLVFMFLTFILYVNSSMFVLMVVFFKCVSFAADPLGDIIGFAVLTAGPLMPVWKSLSGLPIAPFTKFNNTLVMGGFIMAAILSLPVWFGVRGFILYYRKNLQKKTERFKIVQALNLSGIIDFIKGDK
jgi:uncharacterized protein (TIGR03546 family)